MHRPWAEAIAAGLKDVENRTWPAPFTGPLAIHAGLQVDVSAARNHLIVAHGLVPGPGGAIVAVAELTGCHFHGDTGAGCAYRGSAACSAWAEPNRWHWQLADVRRLPEAIACRGALGLWSLPADQQRLVEELLTRPRTSRAEHAR